MINLDDASMIFTLNGELLITNKGSELAFADYEIDSGKSTKLPTPFHVHGTGWDLLPPHSWHVDLCRSKALG